MSIRRLSKISDKIYFSDAQEKHSPRSMIEPAEITFACILIVFFDPVPEYSQNVLLGTPPSCSVIERPDHSANHNTPPGKYY